MDKESVVRVDLVLSLIKEFEKDTLTRINKLEKETFDSIAEIKKEIEKIATKA
ncbi:MAG TPA: hypothetical protein VH500_10580 [Nitrososphaeraceae archaeon]|jgi:hypothetical protein